jgi:AraC family transcriptional regulator of arabinose operon
MVVLSGHPHLLAGDKRQRTSRGSLIVAGPDVPYGWSDRPNAPCSLLVWFWSQPPEIGAKLDKRTCWLRTADAETTAELEQLHRLTRREIQRPDSFSPEVVAALKKLIDTNLARSARGPAETGTRDAHRLQLAEQWLRRHLDVRAPAAALADYLGVSAMGLQRLFRQATGRAPGRVLLEMKMREASRLLSRPDSTVKETAHTLGYRHPGDFTRAYAKFHGHSPSDRSRMPIEKGQSRKPTDRRE